MVKVFISQPMNDKTPEEILEARNRAIQYVMEKYCGEADIIDSYFKDFEENKYKNVPLAYLEKSIELLATADVAVFCKGWKIARGCSIEFQCAATYGVEVITFE